MEYKYSINGNDLCDTEGLAVDKPRFSLGAGTSLPIPPAQKKSYTETDDKSGAELGARSYVGVTKVPVQVVVTGYGDLPTERANLLENRDEVLSYLEDRDPDFPVLRFHPELRPTDPIPAYDGWDGDFPYDYYEAPVVIESLDWKEISDTRGTISMVLAVPGVHLKTPWKVAFSGALQQQYFDDPYYLYYAFVNGLDYKTFRRDQDYILQVNNSGNDLSQVALYDSDQAINDAKGLYPNQANILVPTGKMGSTWYFLSELGVVVENFNFDSPSSSSVTDLLVTNYNPATQSSDSVYSELKGRVDYDLGVNGSWVLNNRLHMSKRNSGALQLYMLLESNVTANGPSFRYLYRSRWL